MSHLIPLLTQRLTQAKARILYLEALTKSAEEERNEVLKELYYLRGECKRLRALHSPRIIKMD